MDNLNTQEGYKAFQRYLALKLHFTTEKYDFVKYRGAVKASPAAFMRRRDRFFFAKLERKYRDTELTDFFVANFVNNKRAWVGEFVSDDGEATYQNWRRVNESLSYIFQQNIETLHEICPVFDDLFVVEDHQHPLLFKLFLQKKVLLETFVILDIIVQFSEQWDELLSDDIMWKQNRQLLNKYRPFITCDAKKMRQILLHQYK